MYFSVGLSYLFCLLLLYLKYLIFLCIYMTCLIVRHEDDFFFFSCKSGTSHSRSSRTQVVDLKKGRETVDAFSFTSKLKSRCLPFRDSFSRPRLRRDFIFPSPKQRHQNLTCSAFLVKLSFLRISFSWNLYGKIFFARREINIST